MKCVMHQVHGSSLSPHNSSATKQTSWTKLHLLPVSNKTARWHFPTSWKAFRSVAIKWSASCSTVPWQSKPTLNEKPLNDAGCQQKCHTVPHNFFTDPTCSAFDNPKVALRPTRLFSLEGLLQFSSQRLPVKKLYEVRLDYILPQW